MREFGFESTASEVLAGIDLRGRTAFITGGYSGIGEETARTMTERGAHVVIAGRDLERAEASAQEMRNAVEGAEVEAIACDLGSLDAVRTCGEEARSRLRKIDLLINNAGVMACPFGRTADDFELQFGTNHLGHFLLTRELMPLVETGERARIVNLSSLGHHRDQVHFEDPNYEHRGYEKWSAYGQSKTANILFTVGLEARFASQGIHSFAVHPGAIMTNLGRHLTEEDIAALRKTMEERAANDGGQPEGLKTIPQGAATTCFAATAPELEGRGGVYLENVQIAKVDDESTSSGVRSYALDPGNAERLWAMSEALVDSSRL
ncbi:MAG: SDR family NAD(P)-dependent oxidoreductase [Acidobacteriota bacterium]